jgi:hypothetical protein
MNADIGSGRGMSRWAVGWSRGTTSQPLATEAERTQRQIVQWDRVIAGSSELKTKNAELKPVGGTADSRRFTPILN